MSALICPQCNTRNNTPARFCNGCGVQFTVQPTVVQPKKKSNAGWLVLLLLILPCAICGIGDAEINKLKLSNVQQQKALSNSKTPLPTPTPELTDTQKLQKAKSIIESDADDKQIDEAVNLIKTIPKNAKEYKEGQKLYNKAVYTITERAVIGAKPMSSGWDGGVSAVKSYLRETLNDYDSSEFLEWSDVAKVYVKKEPFWAVRLKIRAKNSFGGYVVKDAIFYIRQNQVVSSQGL